MNNIISSRNDGSHMPETANNQIKATDRSLRIIEELKQRDGAGVTELAESLNTTKGTIHNHLNTLREHGYVVKNDSTYRLGLRFLEVGTYTRSKKKIYDAGKSEVENLAEETGEVANLMIEEQGRGIFLCVSEGKNAIELDTRVGSRQQLHNSALGKAILSEMSESELEIYINQHNFLGNTPNTLTNTEDLRESVKEIRARGVALDIEEWVEGVRCVAAPITDKNNNNLLGAVSVSGPAPRLDNNKIHNELCEKVINSATVIGINASEL